MSTLLKVIAWWFAISLILGFTWGFINVVWGQVQERHMASLIIKYLEEEHEDDHSN